MKLYMDPVSMISRPVRLFIHENGIACEEQVVELMTGEHTKEPFLKRNPNRQVPVLEDGDFRLTGSSAILKEVCGYRQSIQVMKELMNGRMYPTTLEGLERAMRQLAK